MADATCAAPDCDQPAKRRWCSETCRMRVWKREYKAKNGVWYTTRYRVERPCVDCGAAHLVDEKRWEAGGHQRCRSCQSRLASKLGAAATRRKALDGTLVRHPGKPRKNRALVGPVPRRNSETARFIAAQSVKVNHPPLNGSVFVFGDCRWCGESFLALAGSWETRSLYCSTSCAGNAGKHRRGRFVIPATVRREIYERDGWVCQLCDDPVDPSLDSSDMWAATLDHIVPRSLQLVPDDSPSNLQLAHRWCNSVKGDGRYYDEEVLKVG